MKNNHNLEQPQRVSGISESFTNITYTPTPIKLMSKTFLYKIFKIGQIPKHLLAQINSEDIVLKEEGIAGSITYKKFRAPGQYSLWKKTGFSGSLILTQKHFLAFQFSQQIIGVAWKHKKDKLLTLFAGKGKYPCC